METMHDKWFHFDRHSLCRQKMLICPHTCTESISLSDLLSLLAIWTLRLFSLNHYTEQQYGF